MRAIHAEAPGLQLVAQASIRDRLFPLLEPSTQPNTEQELGALMARPEVKERLASLGLRYLVAVSGGTVDDPWRAGIGCFGGYPGAGGCFGYSWHDQHTTLYAGLWNLTQASAAAAKESAAVEGKSIVPAFVLPVPLPANTKSEA